MVMSLKCVNVLFLLLIRHDSSHWQRQYFRAAKRAVTVSGVAIGLKCEFILSPPIAKCKCFMAG